MSRREDGLKFLVRLHLVEVVLGELLVALEIARLILWPSGRSFCSDDKNRGDER